MDRAAWQATVHGVAKSPTRLSDRKTIHTELRVLRSQLPSAKCFLHDSGESGPITSQSLHLILLVQGTS